MEDDVETLIRQLSVIHPSELAARRFNLRSKRDLETLLDSDLISSVAKSKLVLDNFEINSSLKVIKDLGTSLTKFQLFHEDEPGKTIDLDEFQLAYQYRETLISQTIETIEEEVQNLRLVTDELLPIEELTMRVIEYLQLHLSANHGQSLRNIKLLYNGIIRSIPDEETLLTFYESLYNTNLNIVVPIQDQLLLIYAKELVDQPGEAPGLYDLLASKNYIQDSIDFDDFISMGFDHIYHICKVGALPSHYHRLISEIQNQELLIDLFRLNTMKSHKDIIFSKLSDQSILRLIRDHSEYELLELLNSKDRLYAIFYEIDDINAKAVIVRKLKDASLGFEVLQTYFENEREMVLTRAHMEEIFILLELRQLAHLKLSIPSEYNPLIDRMIEEKRTRKENDYSFFA